MQITIHNTVIKNNIVETLLLMLKIVLKWREHWGKAPHT